MDLNPIFDSSSADCVPPRISPLLHPRPFNFRQPKIRAISDPSVEDHVGGLENQIPERSSTANPSINPHSVIAVCKLSTYLFPDRELSVTRVSISVGVMNLVGCWFGAMPVCHGAGGSAGQHRFGAKSGMSVVILGMGKLVIELVLGNSFVMILNQFPIGILGVLLCLLGLNWLWRLEM
ncbi:Molybdate transporter 2 [Linum perenne]